MVRRCSVIAQAECAVSLNGDDPGARAVQDEVIGSNDAPTEPQLQSQDQTRTMLRTLLSTPSHMH